MVKTEWQKEAKIIRNLVRGLHPSPGAWTLYQGQQLLIDSVDLGTTSHSKEPGRIIDWDSNGILVSTMTDDLIVRQLHLENDPAISIEQAVHKLGIRRGDFLERISGSNQQ